MSARLRGAALVLACVASLAACGGGDDVNTGTDPVEVEVGKGFSWNGFVVDDGWELNAIKRPAGAEEVTTPEVKGTITNTDDEERAAIFQMVFSADGDALATVNCTAGKMAKDQSQSLVCPGLSAEMPEDYDAVVVQEFTRDTSSS
ncbi:hypothetical protein [Nocardioides zhouii]|uniref:Lipoprotein n=1 Tax=Nocardioides zhouii TaxID=1168729 RepID=A0A4Q2SW55_9ACTN|nr:hypothetical protein [Nocardioides zhouii]RYC09621.1 hypothetical protein EUA94_13820 [Nocardioides zhouii]